MSWGRCGADITQGKAVSDFYCTTFVQKQFRRRGPRHSQEGDTWREYGKKTTHLLYVNPQHIGMGKDPPTVDPGHARFDSQQDSQHGGWLGTGPATLFYCLF